VLITGASGGVGVAAIQLAKAMGHTVVALSRGTAKRAKLSEIGADIIVDPTEADWPRTVLKTLSPRRVDLAIDNIGGAMLPQVIQTMGDQGKISLVGRLGRPGCRSSTRATMFFPATEDGRCSRGRAYKREAQAVWAHA